MNKEKLNVIREKLKEKWHKKSDAATMGELCWRDGLVKKSKLHKLAKFGISANLITLIGIGFLIKFTFNLFQGVPPQNQILLIVGILASDALDGPFARLNDNVTAIGTILDHTRDWVFAFVLGIATFLLTLPSGGANTLLFFMALISTLVIFLLVSVKFFKEIRGNGFFDDKTTCWNKLKETLHLFSDYAMNHLQTNLRGRIHFGGLAGAFFLFALSQSQSDFVRFILKLFLLDQQDVLYIGYATLGGAIIMAVYNLLEDHIFNGNE